MAKALHDWLPYVLQAVEPWLSSSDIRAGARWASELELQLQESRVGIICLTPENLTAPWILFEAGALALSKTIGSTYVCPYLFGFTPENLSGPLVLFQATTATKEGTQALIVTLNRALGENSVQERRLEETFNVWWHSLEEGLREISTVTPSAQESARLPDAMDKVNSGPQLDVLSDIVRSINTISPSVSREPDLREHRVFLVHGQNLAVREVVARFIEELGLAVIMIEELPSSGRTIFEKFESSLDVGYAVVLMTADDIGARKGGIPRARARQNVIFELGFFTAKLGRSRLAVLFEENEESVEVPSNFSGILYLLLDKSGAWKFKLAQELKRAGLRANLNNVV